MNDVKVSWLELDTAAVPVDVRVSWLEFDTAAVPVDVRVSWLEFDTAAATASSAKSGVNRLWLIEYYTREYAEKEKLQTAKLEGLTAAARRKIAKKAKAAQALEIDRAVAKAEVDLEVLTQGIKDVEAAQRFIYNLIQQAQLRPEPGVDFMQIAQAYRKRMRDEDDDLLLLSMVL